MTRLMSLAACLVATCALGLAAIPAARADLLTNGGFETESATPAIPPTGWTATGTGMAVDSSFTHTGNYDVAFTAVSNPGTLSQTVVTAIGQSYTLSFWLLDQNLIVGSEAFNVNFGAFSTSYSGAGLTGGSYDNLVVTIPGSDVTSTSNTLSFTGLQDSSNPLNASPVFNLDDVSLTANSAAVPEPTAAAVLGVALGLTALFAARRRHPGRG